jgi:AraC-like DNA-binding protein
MAMIRVQEPSSPLRPFVQNYADMQVDVRSAVLFWPIPARTFACLEFTFGVPYEIHDLSKPVPERTFASALIGAKTHRQISLELNGHVETFVILLQPSGLQQLFGVPEAEIVDTHYDAHGVIGAAISDLRTQLGEAGSFAARACIADEYLLRCLTNATSPGIPQRAARAIVGTQGCVRVRDVAAQTGLSVRHFERVFTRELGIPPKVYARIARFESAVRMRSQSPANTWARIAQDLGYHDQMHLVHDFELLSGESPNALLRKLDLLAAAL